MGKLLYLCGIKSDMPVIDQKWKPWIKAGGFAFLIAIAVTVITVTKFLIDYRQGYQLRTDQIQLTADIQIGETCVSSSPETQQKCIAAFRNAAEAEKRQETELYVQQQLATWAIAGGATGILSIIASIGGMFFIWRTLQYNRAAVDVALQANSMAREIGYAQVRAYLNCKSSKFRIRGNGHVISIEIENLGQSPARNINATGTLTISQVIGRPSMPRTHSSIESNKETVECQPLMSKGTTIEELYFSWPTSFRLESNEEFTSSEEVFKNGNELSLDLSITWDDVFGETHESKTELILVIGPHPSAGSPRNRLRSGKMGLRAYDRPIR
jgi:hypothetical protein